MEEEVKTKVEEPNIIPTPNEVVKEVHDKNFNKSWLLVGGLVILTAALLIVSLTSKKNYPTPQATSNPMQVNVSHTVLTVSDAVSQSTIPGKYSTDVLINTGANHITGVDLKLTFDPKELTNVDVTPGAFIQNAVVIAKTVDQAAGTIQLTLGTPQGAKGVTGEGTIAAITFSKADNNSTSIDFAADSLVTDENYAQSVLKETVSATIGALPTGSAPSAKTSPTVSR